MNNAKLMKDAKCVWKNAKMNENGKGVQKVKLFRILQWCTYSENATMNMLKEGYLEFNEVAE